MFFCQHGAFNLYNVVLFTEFYARVDSWNYPEKIKSLTKNVITHHYRKYLKEAAWTIAP